MDIRFGQVHKFHPFHGLKKDHVYAKVSLPGIPDRFELTARTDPRHPSVLLLSTPARFKDNPTRINSIQGHLATSKSTLMDKIKTGTLFKPVNIKLIEEGRRIPVDNMPQIGIDITSQEIDTIDDGEQTHIFLGPEEEQGTKKQGTKGTPGYLIELRPIKHSEMPETYQALEEDGKEIAEEWEWQQTQPEPNWDELTRTGAWQAQNAWYDSDNPDHPKRYPGL